MLYLSLHWEMLDLSPGGVERSYTSALRIYTSWQGAVDLFPPYGPILMSDLYLWLLCYTFS